MKKNKFNPQLLKKEIARMKLLESYDFYFEDKNPPEFQIDEDDDVNQDPQVDNTETPQNDAPNNDISNPEKEIEDELGISDDGGEEEIGDIPEPSVEEEPVDDGIEIDVTALVKSSDEAKMSAEQAKSSAERALKNTEIMLQKLSDMEKRLLGFSTINGKIENLEQELIKRVPTPVEKMELRSFDSYPYNQKLSDFWNNNEEENNEPKEYVLTKDDINNSYSESEIKNSFNDYEEEDI